MKTILSALFFLALVSCTKESVTVPKPVKDFIGATSVTYKDNSISVIDFKAQPTDNGIVVGFTTLFEKDITRLEILKGSTATNLCSIYQQNVEADSYSALQYSTRDINENKLPSLYYMVKYTLANGDWGYTPVYKLNF